MTDLQDLQDLQDKRSGPPASPTTGAEPAESAPRKPRWRWVALAVAIAATIGLVGAGMAYQGSQDDLAGAEDRISVLVIAGEADAVLLDEALAESDTLRVESVDLTERLGAADAILVETDAAVVGLFMADSGEGIPGVPPEQLQCMSEAVVADLGSAAAISGLTAAALDPTSAEAFEMGLSVIANATACGISPEVFGGVEAP